MAARDYADECSQNLATRREIRASYRPGFQAVGLSSGRLGRVGFGLAARNYDDEKAKSETEESCDRERNQSIVSSRLPSRWAVLGQSR